MTSLQEERESGEGNGEVEEVSQTRNNCIRKLDVTMFVTSQSASTTVPPGDISSSSHQLSVMSQLCPFSQLLEDLGCFLFSISALCSPKLITKYKVLRSQH